MYFSLCSNGYNGETSPIAISNVFNQMLWIREKCEDLEKYQTTTNIPICSQTLYCSLEFYLPIYIENTLKSRIMSISNCRNFSIVLFSIIHYLKYSPTFFSHKNYSIISDYVVQLSTNHSKSK